MSPTGQMGGEASPNLPLDFGRHNMFAFGRDAVFLSHLPMFMAPHDAQLILEVALEDANGSLQMVWSRERADHQDERVYTMMPELFALSTLYTPNPPARSSFTARFFRGHLERGGEAIPELTDIDVRINTVVYAQRFDRAVAKPDDLTYLLFGQGDELFLAHALSRPPDFDQILSVRVLSPPLGKEETTHAINVVFPGRPNTAKERVRDGVVGAARGHITGAHQFLDLEIAEARELYFEEGELATSRGAFEPTPLETEAGFGD